MKKSMLFIILILSIAIAIKGQTSQDRDALIAIYNATNGANWTNQNNWNTSEPIENWGGVTVENGRVVELRLFENNNVAGYIPPEIGELTELRSFIAYNCNLTGNIPSDIGFLSKLQDLNLGMNQLAGSIPIELYSLTELRGLWLKNNNLTGSIDHNIGNLRNLMFLQLGQNDLSGELPSTITNCTKLQQIELWNTDIGGEFPQDIGKLTDLLILNLWDCNFFGEIPENMGNCQSLEVFVLGNNKLTGELPDGFYNLTNLKNIQLQGMEIGGPIKEGIKNFTDLQTMYLDHSNFTDLPDMSNLTNLTEFNVQENKFTFEDIEPNISLFDASWRYAGQQKSTENVTINRYEGSDIILESNVGGSNNHYQWYKDFNLIEGANNNTLEITSAEASDNGSYHCVATNSNVPDMEIQTGLFNVNINQNFNSEYQALYFNGDDTYVELPNNLIGNEESFTIEAWVKPQWTDNAIIFSHGSSAAFALTNNHIDILYIYGEFEQSGWESVSGNYPFQINKWHHVTGVYDNSENIMSVYVDGVLLNRRNFDNDAQLKQPGDAVKTVIGASKSVWDKTYFNGFLKGYIYNVRLSNSVRYEDNFTPDLEFISDNKTVGLWKFRHENEAIAYDYSGSGFNGKIYNGSYKDDKPEKIDLIDLEYTISDELNRNYTIPVPETENTGFGDLISGVDLDKDGNKEIYASNAMFDNGGNELIPRLYKYEFINETWELVWQTELDIPLQNTWAPVTTGDWDNDGKGEIIWGPVNYLDAGINPNPSRIVVFEVKGDGSDELGIYDGQKYQPNTEWSIIADNMVEMRPVRWHLYDIDKDNREELIFADRKNYLKMGIISVDNIPDNQNETANWELEYSAKDEAIPTSIAYDILVFNDKILLIHSDGRISQFEHENDTYALTEIHEDLMPSGTWRHSIVNDINKDDQMEAVLPIWSSGNEEVYLLIEDESGLTSHKIADFHNQLYYSGRLYGCSAGDIDYDELTDIVIGSRGSLPNGAVYRLEYQGGSIKSTSSYEKSLIDIRLAETGGQTETIEICNLDNDHEQEIVYSVLPRNSEPIPVAILDHINSTPIELNAFESVSKSFEEASSLEEFLNEENLEEIYNNIQPKFESILNEENWLDEEHLADNGFKVYVDSKFIINQLQLIDESYSTEIIEISETVVIELSNGLDKLTEIRLEESFVFFDDIDCKEYNCKKLEKKLAASEENYSEGSVFVEKGNYKKAIDKFRKVWMDLKDLPLLFNKSQSNNNIDLMPTEFSLSQNYPNPFNPVTNIRYSIKEASMVNLTVFNMLGEKVATLVNSTQSPGRYSVIFNAPNYPSGTYVYRLSATGNSKNYVNTKKMLLIK